MPTVLGTIVSESRHGGRCLAGSSLAQKKRRLLKFSHIQNFIIIINLKSLEKLNVFSPSKCINFPRSRSVPIQKRLKLVELVLEKGLTISRAGKILGFKPSTAKLVVKRYRETGMFFFRKTRKTQPQANEAREEGTPVLTEIPEEFQVDVPIANSGSQGEGAAPAAGLFPVWFFQSGSGVAYSPFVGLYQVI